MSSISHDEAADALKNIQHIGEPRHTDCIRAYIAQQRAATPACPICHNDPAKRRFCSAVYATNEQEAERIVSAWPRPQSTVTTPDADLLRCAIAAALTARDEAHRAAWEALAAHALHTENAGLRERITGALDIMGSPCGDLRSEVQALMDDRGERRVEVASLRAAGTRAGDTPQRAEKKER